MRAGLPPGWKNAYTGNGPFVLRYVCHRSALDNGEPPCITFGGLGLDEAISREIMIVLEPAAIEAAVLATEQETLQHDEILSYREPSSPVVTSECKFKEIEFSDHSRSTLRSGVPSH